MIISLYAHGMSVRDILHHLEQVYGTQLSAETDLLCRVGQMSQFGRTRPVS